MVENPIVEMDEYSLNQNILLKRQQHQAKLLTSLRKQHRDLQPLKFRFADTQKDRINKSQEEAKFLDSVPNPNVSIAFQKIFRKRNREKEIGPEIRFKPKNSVERVYDHLVSGDSCYLKISEITDSKLSPSPKCIIKNSIQSSSQMRNQNLDRSLYSQGFIKTPRQLLPDFHRKTHFKAAVSIVNREPGTLSLEDGSLDTIMQDINSARSRKQEIRFRQSLYLNQSQKIDNISSIHSHRQYDISSKNTSLFPSVENIHIQDQQFSARKIDYLKQRKTLDYVQFSDMTKDILRKCNVV